MQKEQLYRNATLSFIIINFWSLYCFFEFFTEQGTVFCGLGVFNTYIMSILFSVAIGTIAITLRLFTFKKEKKNKLKNNLLYIFSGIFNLNIFIIYTITIILNILEMTEGYLVYFAIGNLLISGIIIGDIFELETKIKTHKLNRERTT